MIRALLLLALMAAPASAQTRDEVAEGLWEAVNGTVAGQVFGHPGNFARTQIWECQTCAPGQSLRIGWYDWTFNYDTTDPAVMLRAIGGACQFDPCTTQTHTAQGLEGLIQTGTHRRGGPSARTYLVVGDRMWSLYAQGASSVEAATARALDAEAVLLPLILSAQP